MRHLVSDWMTKHPIQIDKYEDIETAADLMHQECISHLIVLDQGRPSGVLSEKDLVLVRKILKRFTKNERPGKVLVGDLMSRVIFTVGKDVSIVEAIRM